MSVIFRDYVAAAGSVFDAIFGEPFIAFPMAFIGGKFVYDISRSTTEISGNLIERAAFDDMIGHHGQRAARNITSEVATTHSTIEILADALPYALKAKDRLQRVADRIFWEIQGIQADDLDHVTFRVSVIGPLV